MIYPRFEIGNGLDINDRVYKYMTLNQFLYLIENNMTYFTRIECWDDSWEAPRRNIPVLNENGKIEYPIYSSSSDLFGQCWTLKEESDAMWRIYSPNKDEIKIATSVKKFELITGIDHYAVNKVYYYSDLRDGLQYGENMEGLSNLLKDGLIKRVAFNHEEEVRLLTLNDERILGKRIKDGNHIQLGINVIEFIEDIVIDPRADDYYIDTIRKYCRRVGLKITPKKSELYSDNIYEKERIAYRYVPIE